jgi:hypothetical protein
MTRNAFFLSLLAFACLPLACGDEFSNGGGNAPTTSNGGGAVTNSGAGAGGGGIGTGGMPNQGMCADGNYQVPTVPDGWQGPVMVWQQNSDETAPPCPTQGLQLDVFNGIDGGDVDCNCDCSDPNVSNCNAALTSYGLSNSCGSSGTLVATLVPNTCTAVTLNGTDYLSWEGRPACAPITNNTIPTPYWGGVIRACSLPTTDNMGTTCANPEDPFDNRMCVVHDGYQECPAGYPELAKVWDSFTDGRSCTDCSCGTTGTVCKGGVSFYGDTSCSAQAQLVLPGNGCEIAGGVAARYGAALDQNAACPPATTTPTGEIDLHNERVICCTN